ncbi:MAG: cobyrinate a,c-diamide synthase [Bacillota bacterium]
MNRVLIAGTHSGCGKTTVTCALLSAFKMRGMDVSAFKCGPDYIDPMFHREIVGVRSHNLDPFFCGGGELRGLLTAHAGELSVIEGVMGYYDGVGPEGTGSTYDVARQTDTPVVLVVDVKGMAASAGAVLHGFRSFRPQSRIRGVIFNGVSPVLYEDYKEVARAAGVPALGFLPRLPELTVKSRHLGLITAGEIADIKAKLVRLGKLAEQYIDMTGILELARSAPALDEPLTPEAALPRSVRVAVARDKAFCFLYQENLELLESLGCELVFFSPLCDRALPERIGGLYLPGGYPELHLEALSSNAAMRRAIREAVPGGLPTVAECGGFLYLHESLDGYPMAGVINAKAFKTDKLQRFGYVTLTANADNLLCAAGNAIRAHEFHYYDSADNGTGFAAKKARDGCEYACVHATSTLYAGFPHLYFPANPSFAESFVRKAAAYAQV